MELATLITETVKLSDDAQRANLAGHPVEAKDAMRMLNCVLQENESVFCLEPEPENTAPTDSDNPDVYSAASD